MKRLSVFVMALAMLAFTSACGAGDNANHANANANHANANHANANVVNTNTANANTRRTYNANITEEEYNRDRDRYTGEAREAGETIGSGLRDGWLWVKTKGALAGVDDLRDSTINVDINNAVVTLRGSVGSAAQKARAEQTAKGIDGVTSVRNQLTVSAAGGNSNNANR